ncbi:MULTISPECIES: GerMN domain-containing protein [Fusobacterium]|uniref:GerMN domain-containing protein n=1 Tax=Fusobacterium TaxID=848 RepID=UPI00147741BD|nr:MULTISPECIES: GerMN domain-containing protein [Fusobacterium]NME36608.1 GerMN domain-containing protein [Fusobacterium sp. FSA-380-WT-3A]
MIKFVKNDKETEEKEVNLRIFSGQDENIKLYDEVMDNKKAEESKKENLKYKFEKKEKQEKNNKKEVVKEYVELVLGNIKKFFSKEKNGTIKIVGILWGITLLSGYLYFNSLNEGLPKTVFERKDITKVVEKQKLYVFYPDNGQLVSEEIETVKPIMENDIIKETLYKNIEKLKNLKLIPNINEKTEVFYYRVDSTLYLDLPEKIFSNVKNPKEELLLIYSFVNTLTNLDSVEEVKILINGIDVDKVKYSNLKGKFKYRKDI